MPEFLTRREMAIELQISPKTLRRMERDGIGPRPIILSPRLARYPASAIAEFSKLPLMVALSEGGR